jgi:hypothetical protein
MRSEQASHRTKRGGKRPEYGATWQLADPGRFIF